VVITSESDDKAAWVHHRAVYERMALKLTALNIKLAFLNQPIEVANVRGQFQKCHRARKHAAATSWSIWLCDAIAAGFAPTGR